jgi:hypothetical protein
MTQEEKNLLLKDLCARLPYGVKVLYEGQVKEVQYIEPFYGELKLLDFSNYTIEIEEIKPYLRPMSSMTEEEDKEYAKVIVKSQDCSLENSESATTMANDWLLSKGFDVRGLISKGLALVAPEGMYEY